MARWQKARPQCLRSHPRGMRGETGKANRGDEGRDCGSTAVEGSGRGRWAATGGKGQTGEEEKLIKLSQISYIRYLRQFYNGTGLDKK